MKDNGIGVGALLGVAGLALAAGCLLGFGISLLWPRGDSVVVVTASGVSTEVAAKTARPIPTEPPEPTLPPPTKTPSVALGTTRDTPIPFRSSGTIGPDLKLTVLDIVRPADQFVLLANPFNETPVPGREYLQATITFTCEKTSNETCVYFWTDVKLVGADGIVLDRTFYAGQPEEYELSGELFGGAVKQGNLMYLVVKGDEQLVLFYSPFLGTPTYFAVK